MKKFLAIMSLCSCSAQLTQADYADLALLAAKLAKCEAEGKLAHSWDVYQNCKTREGISDAGAP